MVDRPRPLVRPDPRRCRKLIETLLLPLSQCLELNKKLSSLVMPLSQAMPLLLTTFPHPPLRTRPLLRTRSVSDSPHLRVRYQHHRLRTLTYLRTLLLLRLPPLQRQARLHQEEEGLPTECRGGPSVSSKKPNESSGSGGASRNGEIPSARAWRESCRRLLPFLEEVQGSEEEEGTVVVVVEEWRGVVAGVEVRVAETVATNRTAMVNW